MAQGHCLHPQLSQSVLSAAPTAISRQESLVSTRTCSHSPPQPRTLSPPNLHKPLKRGTDQGIPQPAPGGYRQELALFMDTVAAVSLAAALVLHIQQRGWGDIHATSQHSVSTTGPRGGCRHRLHPAGWGAGSDTEGSQRRKTRPPIDRDRYIKKEKENKTKNSSTMTRAEPQGHACKQNVQQPARR